MYFHSLKCLSVPLILVCPRHGILAVCSEENLPRCHVHRSFIQILVIHLNHEYRGAVSPLELKFSPSFPLPLQCRIGCFVPWVRSLWHFMPPSNFPKLLTLECYYQALFYPFLYFKIFLLCSFSTAEMTPICGLLTLLSSSS